MAYLVLAIVAIGLPTAISLRFQKGTDYNRMAEGVRYPQRLGFIVGYGIAIFAIGGFLIQLHG